MTCYMGEGEFICEHCFVGDEQERENAACIGGELDTPGHCAYCLRPLEEFGLTSDGVKYVLGRLEADLKRGITRPEWRWEHGYYMGLGTDAVMLDWIETYIEPIKYKLDKREQRLVDLFVQWRGPRELEIQREAGKRPAL